MDCVSKSEPHFKKSGEKRARPGNEATSKSTSHSLDVAKSKLSVLPSAPGVHFSVLGQCQDMLALRVKGDLGDFNITRKGNGLWRGKRGGEVGLNVADMMLPHVEVDLCSLGM